MHLASMINEIHQLIEASDCKRNNQKELDHGASMFVMFSSSRGDTSSPQSPQSMPASIVIAVTYHQTLSI